MRMNRHNFALAALAALLLTTVATAADKPDFTGQWKLNTSKSDFGQMPTPSSGTSKIDHKDPVLKANTTIVGEQGEFNMDMTYSTDGKETTNKWFGDSELKSVAKWDGAVLLIESKSNFNGNDFIMKTKWTLSADGKTLTQASTFNTPQGEGSQTQLYEKQ